MKKGYRTGTIHGHGTYKTSETLATILAKNSQHKQHCTSVKVTAEFHKINTLITFKHPHKDSKFKQCNKMRAHVSTNIYTNIYIEREREIEPGGAELNPLLLSTESNPLAPFSALGRLISAPAPLIIRAAIS
jgi:hypothetical protein